MKALVIGASAGLGRALSEELAGLGHSLHLLASGQEDLQALASDLAVVHKVSVSYQCVDLSQTSFDGVRERVLETLGSPDAVFVVAGVSSEHDSGAVPEDILDRLLSVNFTALVKFVNAFLPDLTEKPESWLVGLGSVAQARARRSNSVYASCKAGLEFYFNALRHHFANGPCTVQFYRIGYMATQMTFGKKLLFPATSTRDVARTIVRRLACQSGVRYLPRWWGLITLVFRLIPWKIYKNINV